MQRIATLLVLICFLCAAHSQTVQAQDVTGNWQGVLKTGAIEFRVALQVWKARSGDLAGTITFIDTGGKSVPLTDISVKKSKIEFRVVPAQASFAGSFDQDNSIIKGVWTDSAHSDAEFKRVISAVNLHKRAKHSDLDGYWVGTLKLDPMVGCDPAMSEYLYIFHITNTTDGLVVTWDSPYSDIKGWVATSVTRNGASLDLDMKQLAARYHGTLNQEKTSISGTWTELRGRRDYPFVLTRSKHKPPAPEQREPLVCSTDGMSGS
jgi:hypothetical protein